MLSNRAICGLSILGISLAGSTLLLQGCCLLRGSSRIDSTSLESQPLNIAGFSTPESVLSIDSEASALISNINGAPLDKDNNGFISRVNASGQILQLKWIEGGKNNVTLNAPKGMALLDGKLFVTDINCVRCFDAETGAPLATLPIDGATFINDIASNNNELLFSDSGLNADFNPSGSAAVYLRNSSGAITSLALPKGFTTPNGVAFGPNNEILAVDFGGKCIAQLDRNGPGKIIATLPTGGLDGIEVLPNGDWLISSWEGQCIYRGSPSKGFTKILTDMPAPADIGLSNDGINLWIPLFNDNRVLRRPVQ